MDGKGLEQELCVAMAYCDRVKSTLAYVHDKTNYNHLARPEDVMELMGRLDHAGIEIGSIMYRVDQARKLMRPQPTA